MSIQILVLHNEPGVLAPLDTHGLSLRDSNLLRERNIL